MRYLLFISIALAGCASTEMQSDSTREPASVRSAYNYGPVSVNMCPVQLMPPLTAQEQSFSLVDVTLNAPCAQNK